MKLCISFFGVVDKWSPQIIRRQRRQFLMDDDGNGATATTVAAIAQHTRYHQWNWWLVSFHSAPFPFQTKQRQIDELVNGFRTLWFVNTIFGPDFPRQSVSDFPIFVTQKSSSIRSRSPKDTRLLEMNERCKRIPPHSGQKRWRCSQCGIYDDIIHRRLRCSENAPLCLLCLAKRASQPIRLHVTTKMCCTKFVKLSRQRCERAAPQALPNYWFSCVYLSAVSVCVAAYRVTGGPTSFKLSQHKSYTVLINGIPEAVITFSYAKYVRETIKEHAALTHILPLFPSQHTQTRAPTHTHICIFISTIDPMWRVQHGIKLKIGVKRVRFVMENQFTHRVHISVDIKAIFYSSDAQSESRKWNFRRTF